MRPSTSLALLLVPLVGCNYFNFTEVVTDVVQGPAGKLVIANQSDRSLQVLSDENGAIEKEFPLFVAPSRLASHPDHSVVAVSYGENDSRVDLIDVETGSGLSVSLGKEHAADLTWADADRLFVLNDRGFQDIMVIGRDDGALVGGWPLDDLDFHSRLAVHGDSVFINYRRYDLVLEGDGQLHSKWQLATGDFTKIVHKQRVAPDGAGMLYAADGTQAVAEYSAETGALAVRYDLSVDHPDQRIMDFAYDPSGAWVFVLVRTELAHEVAVYERASGEYQGVRYAPGSDVVGGGNFEREFLVPGDEAGEVFVYGHNGANGSITRLLMK